MYDYNEQSKFYGHVCMYVRACVRVCEPCNHLRSLIVTQYSRLFQKDILNKCTSSLRVYVLFKGTRLTGFAHPLLSLFTQLTLKSIYLHNTVYFLYVIISYLFVCKLVFIMRYIVFYLLFDFEIGSLVSNS